jgi:chemotaxis methyl-accepting protein methylase
VKGIGEAPPELTPGPFDVVFCNGVLMYCDNASEMLGALTQVAQRLAPAVLQSPISPLDLPATPP